MKGRNRLRSRQRVLNCLEQGLDTKINESAENLIVVGRHEDAWPKQLDELQGHRNLDLRYRMTLIGDDGDIDRPELLRERTNTVRDRPGAVDPHKLKSG